MCQTILLVSVQTYETSPNGHQITDPKVAGGKEEDEADGPAPHPVPVLHAPDELELPQAHLVLPFLVLVLRERLVLVELTPPILRKVMESPI